MTGNELARKFFGIDRLVDTLLSRMESRAKPKKRTEALKPIPEADMPLIRGLMAQLSDESNPSGRTSAARDLKILAYYYNQMGVDSSKIESEYLLRKPGIPYLRSQ